MMPFQGIRCARMAFPALATIVLISAACQMRFAGGGLNIPPTPSPEAINPPWRVARLSYLEGAISLQPAGTDVWSLAEINRPLVAGDELWTEAGARAEIHLGFAAIRIDGLTNFGLLDMTGDVVQAKLTEGLAVVSLRRLNADDRFELDTPNAAITFSRPGEYRVEVSPEGTFTNLSVRSGQAEVTGTKGGFEVSAGQLAKITGAGSADHRFSSIPAPDEFDRLCDSRDRREDIAASARFVAPDVLGYYDLDDAGVWLIHANWGPYWAPRHVPAGWAPYRFGHWLWIEPWGWTWVDDMPWGFAPFHYGRWAVIDSAWSWIPGPRHLQPIYAPALVVFLGGGRPDFHFFFWIGSAGVAWFPLGPGEVYVPPYRCTQQYLANINLSNTAIRDPDTIGRIDAARQSYANRSEPGAGTAVSREAFAGGRAIGGTAVAVATREIALAQITGSTPPVAPTRDSLVSRSESRTAPRPPERAANRLVMMRRAPSQSPVSFERRQPLLNAQPGRPPQPADIESLRRGEQIRTPLQKSDERRTREIQDELHREKQRQRDKPAERVRQRGE